MLIGLVTSGLAFTGDTIKTGSLGGSETALCCVAREFVKRGHKVRVFCNCPAPGVYDGVEYYALEHAPHQIAITPFDVLIASRWADFVAVPSNAGLRVLWNHDVLTDPDHLVPRLWQTDLLMCLSKYHIDDYCGPEGEKVKGKLSFLREHIWQTSNGVDLDVVNANKRPKVAGKLIFTSRPERGLYKLLKEIFPKLLEKRPNLRLHYCTYDLGNMEVAEDLKALYAECDRLAKSFGRNVVNMGSLAKAGLYSQMSSAQLLVAPTEFPEIFMIGCAEAQACGTPVVATRYAAIAETAGPDSSFLIDCLPSDPEYTDKFVAAVDSLLDENNELNEEGKRLSENGPTWVVSQGYTWDKIAESWERKFSDMLDERFRKNKPAIVKELLRQNDVQAAALFAKKEGLADWTETVSQHPIVLREVSQENITEKIKDVTTTYHNLVHVLAECVKTAHTVLDLFCDDACFGMVVKKALPMLSVTLLAQDADTAERLKEYATRTETDCVVTADPERLEEKYNVVFIGDKLELQRDPQSYLERITQKYLKPGGSIVGYCNYGTEKLRWDLPSNRLWNLSRLDLEALFADPDGEYRLTFSDLRDDKTVDPEIRFGFVATGFKTFGKFDIAGRARRARPYQTLDVGMIVKDEENWISGALKSVENLADNIIVIDTGCSDHTREILKWHDNIQVIEAEFEDFSQVRNLSRDASKGDWFLWFDADERLVKPHKVRQYLRTSIVSGYAIPQRHLMLDLQGSYDLPVRLLKNRPHYRFTGAIHEHCEDVSEKPYDNPIEPTLELDCDIVHYGYLNEAARRRKCSYRNMSLLLKDIRDNASKGRMLTWILVMRDYLNICKWEFWKNGPKPVKPGSRMHMLLNAVISTHLNKFADDSTRYTCLAEGLYQEALKILGMSGLCYEGMDRPPFEVDLALVGAERGLDPKATTKPDRKWFLNAEEFLTFLHNRGTEVVTGLNLCSKDECPKKDVQLYSAKPSLPDAEKLLRYGVAYK